MKKIVVQWDSNESQKIVGMSHPGCCSQSGGCGKKHG